MPCPGVCVHECVTSCALLVCAIRPSKPSLQFFIKRTAEKSHAVREESGGGEEHSTVFFKLTVVLVVDDVLVLVVLQVGPLGHRRSCGRF